MGIRSEVAFSIVGPKDKLDFLRRWADILFVENCADNELTPTAGDNWILRFQHDWIKWYTDMATKFGQYYDLYLFNQIWELAEYWGLDGKLVELCFEFPAENPTIIINNGNRLEFPRLIMRVEVE
jgi:hypothetical protein